MQKTKIEWCDYTINPVKGLCPVDCKDNQGKSYCYARAMYKRFKWNPDMSYDYYWGVDNYFPPQAKVFVGSTIELFGDWVKDEWLLSIFDAVKCFPKTTFIFLTKQPQNLIKWSPFPRNCYVGVSAINASETDRGCRHLYDIKAKVRFLSLEPLLDWQPMLPVSFPPHLSWVIIGQRTPASKKSSPKMEWVKEIVEACDKAGIPVFEKNNLISILGKNLRQEFPCLSLGGESDNG